jgi:LysM repeat protein
MGVGSLYLKIGVIFSQFRKSPFCAFIILIVRSISSRYSTARFANKNHHWKKTQNCLYNTLVHPKHRFHWLLLFTLLFGLIQPAADVLAHPPSKPAGSPPHLDGVTAYDLIIATNTLRVSYGLPALVEDSIIDANAQYTAETMAANNMSWHIGNVSGRLQSAGYGGGAKVWGTENFAVGHTLTIDEIMLMWSDASHMIPVVNPAYCNVGAGIAQAADGSVYYVLEAAYTSNKACGEYRSPVDNGIPPKTGGTTDDGRVPGVPQLIVPVKIATPDADGKVYHIVQPGQSFWSIAIAYKITIADLEKWNNLSKDSKLQIGQKLFIPTGNTVGYATPTPVGMVAVSTPDVEGKIIHTVQAYQTLTSIAQAYGIKIETILKLNGLSEDWPLQIGQKLVIQAGTITPSPTPKPLTPIEKLTPAADGKYYHTVQSGETLSWIASLYEITLADLLSWNGLDINAILRPDQKLLLQVTPPATLTFTPMPATATFTPTPVTPKPTSTATLAPTHTPPLPAETAVAAVQRDNGMVVWGVILGMVGIGLFLVVFFAKKRS